MIREGFNKKKGKVWSFTTPQGGEGLAREVKKSTLLVWGLKKGKNGLKWLKNGQKTR